MLGEPKTFPRKRGTAVFRRADALVAVAEQYLAATPDAGPPVEVVVHVDAGSAGEVGGTLDDGTALPRATTERLACDAGVVEVHEDSRGNVLDVGRRRRTIPTMLRRALRLRDGGCRFPGCTNRFVDGHHVVPWARGGATSLSNLCSLCRRHHTWVHERGGLRIEPDDVVGFRFFDRDGDEMEPQGPPPAVAADPIATIRARNLDDGIAIDAMTSMPNGDFRRPDYGVIVWSLLQAVSV